MVRVCVVRRHTLVIVVGDSGTLAALNLLRHCPLFLRPHRTFRWRQSSAVNFWTSSSLSRLNPPQTIPSAGKDVLPFPRFLFVRGSRDFDFRDSWSRSQILPKFKGTGRFYQYATEHADAWCPNFEPSSRPWNYPIHWATKCCRMQKKKKTRTAHISPQNKLCQMLLYEEEKAASCFLLALDTWRRRQARQIPSCIRHLATQAGQADPIIRIGVSIWWKNSLLAAFLPGSVRHPWIVFQVCSSKHLLRQTLWGNTFYFYNLT